MLGLATLCYTQCSSLGAVTHSSISHIVKDLGVHLPNPVPSSITKYLEFFSRNTSRSVNGQGERMGKGRVNDKISPGPFMHNTFL